MSLDKRRRRIAAPWIAVSEAPQQALPEAIQVFTLRVKGLRRRA